MKKAQEETMRILKKSLPVFFCFLTLAVFARNEQYKLLRDWKSNKPVAYSALKGDPRKVVIPVRYRAERGEMRGVWVGTYSNLDFPQCDTPYRFMQTYRAMVRKIRQAGFRSGLLLMLFIHLPSIRIRVLSGGGKGMDSRKQIYFNS